MRKVMDKLCGDGWRQLFNTKPLRFSSSFLSWSFEEIEWNRGSTDRIAPSSPWLLVVCVHVHASVVMCVCVCVCVCVCLH